MKKIIAMILSLCLLCGAIALAEADNKLTKDNTSADTTLSYTIEVDDGYTITIPSAVTFAPAGQTAIRAFISISGQASMGWNAGKATLNVHVNKVSGTLMRVGAEAGETGIPYTLTDSSDEPLVEGMPVLTINITGSGVANGTRMFALADINGLNIASGTYSDTLTFSAELTKG